ncbi:MAG TPA: sugar ABC transporter permease YjfF [bacterium]|nr:sugar ABC transporter permease YjfF [bacterium]
MAKKHVPIIATSVVFLLLYTGASVSYESFFSWPVFLNLLNDNAFLGLAALGMTFVILSGGIDLSVGSMIGFTSITIAVLVEQHGMSPVLAIPVVLFAGTVCGAGMGAIIAYFRIAPFLVTLAGMFLLRGLALVISVESLPINHGIYSAISNISMDYFPVTAVVFLAFTGVTLYIAHLTPFGRGTYAVGGGEDSAMLMGLPVNRIKVQIYALSGLCSASAGVLYSMYTSSGNATAGTSLELDAIAAVVIGGTLLSGGVGYVIGTFLGVLILGTIQTILIFQGTLSSWWAKFFIGGLLLLFIILQRFIQKSIQKA